MKSYDINEVIEICNSQGYGFVCLTDQKGAELIPYNSRNTPAERLEEIKTRLSSPALKDGVYIVKCKHTNRKNALSDDYLIYKGETLGEAPTITIPTVTAEVLTYESALKLQVKIKELELECENLRKDLIEANNTIQELENELEEVNTLSEEEEENQALNEKPSQMETVKEFLSELVTIGAPLLDKHFDLKQQALNLEAQKLLRGYGTTRPQQNRPQQAPAKHTEQILKVENWIQSKQNDSEIYNGLVAIYNNSKTVEQFMELLRDFNIELYEELTANI
jgi:hypothetical protein